MSTLEVLIADASKAEEQLTAAQSSVAEMREKLLSMEQELVSFGSDSPSYKRTARLQADSDLSAVLKKIEEKKQRPPRFFGKAGHVRELDDLHAEAEGLRKRISDLAVEVEARRTTLPGSIDELRAKLTTQEKGLSEIQQERDALVARAREATQQFYLEVVRPASLALIKSRVDKDRVFFIDNEPKLKAQIESAGNRIPKREVNRCWILYHYVTGFVCGEWAEIDFTRVWMSIKERVDGFCQEETDDFLLELATAFNLTQYLRFWVAIGQSNPMRVVRSELGFDPLEVAERKIVHVMRSSSEDWQRVFGEDQLDKLIQLRREAKSQ